MGKNKYLYPSLLIAIFILIGCQAPTPKDQVVTGAAQLVNTDFDLLKGKRVGLITNYSAVVGESLLIDLLYNAEEVELAALFSPEHGIRGNADAGAHIGDSVDERTGVPVYSLYGKNRKPTPEMLEGIDVLVFDIQDVGARFYTYIATMGYTMQSAAEHGIPYIVLDRPNPLGGNLVEGFVPEQNYKVFKGLYSIPVTHGMTVGEFARMIKGEAYLQGLEDLDLNVVEMAGWSRDMLWPETGLTWKAPSPNIPDFETALIYPGACLFEATHISEGRGTMHPFLLLGSPWADGKALAEKLNSKKLPGLKFEPASFTPESIEGMSMNPKLKGERLQGIRYRITDAQVVRPVAAGIQTLLAFYNSAPDSARKNFFRTSRLNTLAGSKQFFDMIQQEVSPEEIIQRWKEETRSFTEKRKRYLLYN